MKFGLSDKLIDSLKDIFKKYPQIKRVIIYGSRARGDFKPASDIDIAIFSEEDLSPELYFEVDEAVGIYKVDIVEVGRLHNDKLLENILKEGIEIYKQESS
ncbi:DNA polymerase beta domain protein region [Thermoanaerobacter italicus Ab9]|uniref:DNA polymerase beta domain protein region n=1 Tax=Thermoanaerobacter italicus (strain DSM 9252 / Ab9) TaxID=580331 RepID=D3T3Y9_THEIA|nr:nucleotidyltransferase domain-containing protein [Thermoanaerobacter italicus]ADD02941.1 DNA polymerase beta domain protein region [Thermoanaerobacter italicus Ab9]